MSFDPWIGGVDTTESEDAGAQLLKAAGAALDAARAKPGRVRESAFHLLAADALLTYACEACLESPDPGAALERVLTIGWLR